MAGSFVNKPHEDPILSARIESLALLAEHLAEPVMIISPSFELVYTNAAARQFAAECPLLEHSQGKEVFSPTPPEPCESCSGKSVLQVGGDRNSYEMTQQPNAQHAPCPFPQSLVLSGDQGKIGCVLMMGRTAKKTVVVREDRPLLKSLPAEHHERGANDLDELIGESPSMQQVMEMIRLVANSSATVLLQGESGTGKELVARTIHRLSKRRDRPFIVVDCGSLPETLIESELFGYIQGAFTGAETDRRGLFEEAHGGTIFLDEIANTTLMFQAKVLRVLQEGEIKPVGSSQSITVDVRVISATNKPLLDLVNVNAFREDLYYRLAVLPVDIPPLRERREDIPLLMRYFLERSASRHNQPVLAIKPQTVDVLINHSWPGNVRELENVIERAVVTADQDVLTSQGLCHFLSRPQESSDLLAVGKSGCEERARIVQALREAGGNKRQAARLLKISRATLYNKLRVYNVQPAPAKSEPS